MRIKSVFTVLAFSTVFSFNNASCQSNFELPQNLEFKTKEDYKKYEKDFVQASKWLEETDLNKESDKRIIINAFIIQWISGSPTVTIEIGEKLLKLYGKNEALLPIYIGAYARHYIENHNSANKSSATKAGINAMLHVYKKGIDMKKNKELDRLSKMSEGELEVYASKL